MMKPQPKPLGPPIDRTDDDLDRISKITPDDFEPAAAEATDEYRALMEAKTEEPGE